MADDDSKKTSTIIPKDDEYYTLTLDRTPDEDDEAKFDIANDGDDPTDINGSSVYDGHVTDGQASEDDLRNYEEGGTEPKDDVTNQDTVSADVGNPGHWGIDEGTE